MIERECVVLDRRDESWQCGDFMRVGIDDDNCTQVPLRDAVFRVDTNGRADPAIGSMVCVVCPFGIGAQGNAAVEVDELTNCELQIIETEDKRDANIG